MSNDPTQPVAVPEPEPMPDPQASTATMWLDEQLTSEHGPGSHEHEHEAIHKPAANASAPAPVPEPTYLTGPAPTAVIIGLIGLLTLVGTAVWALTDWAVNWAVAAPVGIVVLGLVIIVLGVSGLRRPRS